MNNDAFYTIKKAEVSDNSRINKLQVNIEAGQPTLFDALIEDFLDVDWKGSSALSFSEQMYSAKGSQSIAVGSFVTERTSTNPNNFNESILLQVYSSVSNKPNMYYRKRPIWTAA